MHELLFLSCQVLVKTVPGFMIVPSGGSSLTKSALAQAVLVVETDFVGVVGNSICVGVGNVMFAGTVAVGIAVDVGAFC